MASRLDNISNELFAWIAQNLHVHSLGNLRLVSRNFAQKAILGSYSQAFRSVRLHFTRQDLHNFARVISSDAQLARFIEDVTLVGIACDTGVLERALDDGGIRVQHPDGDAGRAIRIEFVKLSNDALDQLREAVDDLRAQREEMAQNVEVVEQLLLAAFALIKAQGPGLLQHMSLQVVVLEDPRKPLALP